jgi:hypothetical protein
MEKLDYKKKYKNLYIPSTKPVILTVPQMSFIMLDGKGDPNNNLDFEDSVEALYALSYGLKMLPKKGITPEGYVDYSVFPLEGLWWVSEGEFSLTERDNWLWTIMIRQPEFVNEELFQAVKQQVMNKKANKKIGNARLEKFEEGLCVHMMHIGPYSTEPETVEIMESYLNEEGYRETFYKGGRHHEIYLSDPRKAKPESMKTVLRHPIEKTQ